MKSILVTGANGFIGRHTLRHLINQEFQIHAVSSKSLPNLEHAAITWHHADLNDSDAIDNLLLKTKPSHLLHLAWYTKPCVYWSSPFNVDWLNSSLYLLDAFSKSGGQRVVVAGTCAEYAWHHGQCQERVTPCLPQTFYGRAKYALHLLSETIAEQHNISLGWGRIFFLFGKYEYEQRLVASAIRSLLRKQPFIVKHGELIRDFLYVDDVAHALVSFLISDCTGPVNIASGEAITIKELLSMVAKKLDAQDLLHFEQVLSSADAQHASITASTDRLKQEVKWQPRFPLDKGLDETIIWLREIA